MTEATYIEAIHAALAEELERLPTMVILGEDIQEGGVFRVTDGFLERFGPERVLDTPLAESSIVGVAIGMAQNGAVPVAEIQFADFSFPAFNQLVSEAARWRYRSNGASGCPIVVRMPYGAGIQGALYHSQSPEAFYAHVPGLKVVAPSTPHDAKGLLKAAIRDADPVIYFEHKRAYRLIRGDVPEEDYVVPIGKAALRREGGDLTVIAWSMMVHESLEAAAELAAEGIEATVLDLRTLAPLDRDVDPRCGARDREGAGRPRGQHQRRPRRRDRRADRGARLRLPRRAGSPPRDAGHPGDAVQQAARGLLAALEGAHRGGDARAGGLLMRGR